MTKGLSINVPKGLALLALGLAAALVGVHALPLPLDDAEDVPNDKSSLIEIGAGEVATLETEANAAYAAFAGILGQVEAATNVRERQALFEQAEQRGFQYLEAGAALADAKAAQKSRRQSGEAKVLTQERVAQLYLRKALDKLIRTGDKTLNQIEDQLKATHKLHEAELLRNMATKSRLGLKINKERAAKGTLLDLIKVSPVLIDGVLSTKLIDRISEAGDKIRAKEQDAASALRTHRHQLASFVQKTETLKEGLLSSVADGYMLDEHSGDLVQRQSVLSGSNATLTEEVGRPSRTAEWDDLGLGPLWAAETKEYSNWVDVTQMKPGGFSLEGARMSAMPAEKLKEIHTDPSSLIAIDTAIQMR